MTEKEFNNLDLDSRFLEIYDKGKVKSMVATGFQTLLLYSFGSFFVEIEFDARTKEYFGMKTFIGGSELEKYSELKNELITKRDNFRTNNKELHCLLEDLRSRVCQVDYASIMCNLKSDMFGIYKNQIEYKSDPLTSKEFKNLDGLVDFFETTDFDLMRSHIQNAEKIIDEITNEIANQKDETL